MPKSICDRASISARWASTSHRQDAIGGAVTSRGGLSALDCT
jgi:hypothetical protein